MKRSGFRFVSPGFTLLELLLYAAIASTILLAGTSFFALTFEVKTKNQTIAEVEQQGAQTMALMTQTVRNAKTITTPGLGANSSNLAITVVDASKSPTTVQLSSGVLQMTEGAGSAVALTNSRVTVSSLSVQNSALTGTKGSIRISFTLTYTNPTGRNAFDYSKSFQSTATLR